MAEWWVAQVMSQTGRAHYRANLLEVAVAKVRMALQQALRHIVTQTAAHTRHFHAVGEAVVDEYATWKRENLSLVLQTAERRGENQSVVVALELSPVVRKLVVEFFLSEAFGGK